VSFVLDAAVNLLFVCVFALKHYHYFLESHTVSGGAAAAKDYV
jgi:hypothetical protein